MPLVPAQAGIQSDGPVQEFGSLGPRLRGDERGVVGHLPGEENESGNPVKHLRVFVEGLAFEAAFGGTSG